jgi:uncharacterized repeat protein (TIGR03943 family)
MKAWLKPLALVALGLFLYNRLTRGYLQYYINWRFSWLILFAATGFTIIALSYRYRSRGSETDSSADNGSHSDPVGWSSLVLLALTVAVGVIVSPKPLGAAVAANRNIQVSSLGSVSQVDSESSLEEAGNRTILDWLIAFQEESSLSAFNGQEATVIGFVYQDDRFDNDLFTVGRFVVSCCVADATPVGLLVRWSQAETLENDTWVQVSGRFELGHFEDEAIVILVAEAVTPISVPDQPYLYP